MRILAGILLFISSLSTARAQAPRPAGPAPTPPPPSTGREMPTQGRRVLTHDEQVAILARAVTEFLKGGECTSVYGALTAGLWGGATPVPLAADTQPVYTALAVCAHRTGHQVTALRVARELYKHDPNTPWAWLIPDAEISLGLYGDALKDVQALTAARPNDAQVALVYAAGNCKLELWPACVASAAKVRAMLPAVADPRDRRALEIKVDALESEGLFHTGKFDESTAALEAARKLAGPAADPAWEKRLKRNEIVKLGHLAVEPLFDKSIPLGVYHLLGQVKGTRPVLTLKLYNFSDKPRQVRIETEIPGVTEKKVTTKMLMPGKKEVAELTPPLRSDFPIAQLRADRPSQIEIRVASGGEMIYEKSYPVTVLPRDTLPLAQKVDADLSVPSPGFIAAWITPNARAVDAFLNKAKQRAPNGAFAGVQTATFAQVKALWDELQAEGVSYVMDPTVLSDFGFAQRTRLPTEVLESKNAQCLEGTILFATLLEAIGIEPIIVRVPGHAFVGWKPTAKDGAKPGDLAFVETTMVHSAPFDAAVKLALERVREERRAGHFDKGIYGPAFMLDLGDLRRAGFRPQPLD